MKNVIVSALIVALLAAGVCIFSMHTADEAAAQMEALRTETLRLSQNGQTEEAIRYAERMQECWQRYSAVLTVILPHSEAVQITQVLLEGSADLKAGEREEFEADMLLLGELLRHIAENEHLLLSNILSIC